MTTLGEARNSLIIIEHDPLLYRDAQGMVPKVCTMPTKRPRGPALHTWNRYFPGGYDQKCRQSILLRREAESYDEAYFESLSKSAEEPDHPRGLDMIKLPWKLGARPLEPRQTVNPRILELETAKQILEEIFHTRPSDVEEMIHMRLEEKNYSEESWQEEEELWPREFCLGE